MTLFFSIRKKSPLLMWWPSWLGLQRGGESEVKSTDSSRLDRFLGFVPKTLRIIQVENRVENCSSESVDQRGGNSKTDLLEGCERGPSVRVRFSPSPSREEPPSNLKALQLGMTVNTKICDSHHHELGTHIPTRLDTTDHCLSLTTW